jgi:hypothetical protein
MRVSKEGFAGCLQNPQALSRTVLAAILGFRIIWGEILQVLPQGFAPEFLIAASSQGSKQNPLGRQLSFGASSSFLSSQTLYGTAAVACSTETRY